MFGRKKENHETKTDTAPVIVGRGQKNAMNEFFDISVTENALEVFDENKNYFGGDKRDGSAYYIGMMLRTDDVGGFSKKTKNDPDKGAYRRGGTRRQYRRVYHARAKRGGRIDIYSDSEDLFIYRGVFDADGRRIRSRENRRENGRSP
ncbi:hypothetical protein AGMMS49975_22270 [Clostridia bacterium]|nr:hypothetical protein AGMMS49975_22270 [Clostridia bacterium]